MLNIGFEATMKGDIVLSVKMPFYILKVEEGQSGRIAEGQGFLFLQGK